MADHENQRYHRRDSQLLARFAKLLQFGQTDAANTKPRSHSIHGDRGVSEKPRGLDTILESSDQNASSVPRSKASVDSDVLRDNLDRRRHVRTLPPWIHSLQEGEVAEESEDPMLGQLSEPLSTKTPQRNHMPAQKYEQKHNAARGRAWDHARSGEAVTPSFPVDHPDKWHEFIGSSAYARPKSEEGGVVDESWIRDNIPDLNEPYISHRQVNDVDKDERLWLLSESKRSATFEYFQDILMRNPFVPLFIRLTVMVFCLVALALGVQIFRRSNSLNNSPASGNGKNQLTTQNGDYICKQQPSTYLAFIVDSCAVVYLGYITYDEYFSKPLGLRSSKEKIRLLFLDLLFIIFSAANLSLAFNTLTDLEWSCYDTTPGKFSLSSAATARSSCVTNGYLCDKQRGLVSVLLFAEIAWVMTFSISILRVVERISR